MRKLLILNRQILMRTIEATAIRKQIDRVLKLLAAADSPAIIAAGATHWQSAAGALLDFVEAAGIPFFSRGA